MEKEKQTGIIQEQGFIVPGGFNKVSKEDEDKLKDKDK